MTETATIYHADPKQETQSVWVRLWNLFDGIMNGIIICLCLIVAMYACVYIAPFLLIAYYLYKAINSAWFSLFPHKETPTPVVSKPVASPAPVAATPIEAVKPVTPKTSPPSPARPLSTRRASLGKGESAPKAVAPVEVVKPVAPKAPSPPPLRPQSPWGPWPVKEETTKETAIPVEVVKPAVPGTPPPAPARPRLPLGASPRKVESAPKADGFCEEIDYNDALSTRWAKLKKDPRLQPWVESLMAFNAANPCPHCKSDDVAFILGGHFSWMTEFLGEFSKAGLIHLGGCFMTEEDMYCNGCKRKFIHYDDSVEIAPFPRLAQAGGGIMTHQTHGVCVRCRRHVPLAHMVTVPGGGRICTRCVGELRAS